MYSLRFLAVAACVLGVVRAEDASGFRGSANHPGVYETKPLPQLSGVKWKFQTHGIVISSPVLAGETLYVGSADHFLYALDSATGTEKWKFETGSNVVSSPAVANGVVYFLSYDSNCYALDAATGQLKWKFKSAGERRFAAKHIHGTDPEAETMPDPFDVYLSSPLVWAGAVYFGSGDENVYSLDAATGKLKWKFKTGEVVHASPTIAKGILYVGSWDSYFYALDATTGKEKWRFKTGDDPKIHNQVGIQSSAVVADGIVYFGCRDSELYALDAATGEKKWVFDNKGSWVISSPVVFKGRVYFATSDSGLFHALDARTGAPAFTLKFSGWPTFSSPAIAGGILYVGSLSGKLFAIDLAAQKTVWEFQTDGSRQNGATYTKADGTPNYEAAYAGNFYDEMIVGVHKLMAAGCIYASPVPHDGVVYVASTDGNVYALN
jgi:eukaryotic-like serine/threonine-protein kinase